MRKNRYNYKQAPADILKKLIPKLNVVKLFQFRPVVLDNYLRLLLNSNKDTVYYDMKSDNVQNAINLTQTYFSTDPNLFCFELPFLNFIKLYFLSFLYKLDLSISIAWAVFCTFH